MKEIPEKYRNGLVLTEAEYRELVEYWRQGNPLDLAVQVMLAHNEKNEVEGKLEARK